MTVSRPGDCNHVDRIQPVHGDHSEDDQQNRKRKKKVVWQGRSYTEKDDDLPINSATIEQSSKNRAHPEKLDKPKESPALYTDKMILEQARSRLLQFTTLEEKVASLCIMEVEATYDPLLQEELELAVQRDQIGGILFSKGEFKRQAYLIEHLQNLAMTPLLFGNDFFHGLSFYFEGNVPFDTLQNKMDEKRFADLGKAVVAQNRRLGVHFQFDRPLYSHGLNIMISEENIQAFRKGIRDAKGIVGKEKKQNSKPSYSQSSKKTASFTPPAFIKGNLDPFNFETTLAPLLNEQVISETVGLRNLEFLDLTKIQANRNIDEFLIEAFSHSFDAILLSQGIPETIAHICRLVRSGQIQEEEIDKKALRILLVKMLLMG